MTITARARRVIAGVLTVAASLALVVLDRGAAEAQTGQVFPIARFAFSGDAGDWVSQGGSYSYDVAAGDAITASTDTTHNHLGVTVTGANGDWWYLDLAAPSGQPLVAGTYAGATRWPFQAATVPGLSLSGNGRGCNVLTGSFTVQRAVYDATGSIQQFDATYEQHCEAGTTAARGEVHLSVAPPPPPLTVGVTISGTGTARRSDGAAVLSGSVSCSQAVTITVSGTVTQVVRKAVVQASFTTTVACTPGAPGAWAAVAPPSGFKGFQQGSADASAGAAAPDPYYGGTVSASAAAGIRLRTG